VNYQGDNTGLMRKERARDWNTWLFIDWKEHVRSLRIRTR